MFQICRVVRQVIASDSISLPREAPWVKIWEIVVDTEASAATDDLKGISGGRQGDMILLMIRNNSRVITLKDNLADAGGNKMHLAGDFTMNNKSDKIMLVIRAISPTICDEISRSSNS